MNKNSNKKINLLIIFLALLNLGGLTFWILFLSNLNNLKQDNLVKAKELAITEKKIKDLKDLEIFFKEFEEDRGKIEKSIILQKEDLVKFIENLEFLSSRAGAAMEIKSIQLSQIPQKTEDFYPILNIELKSGFNEIYHFLEMLESLPYFVSFDRLTIQKNSPETVAQLKEKEGKEYKWTARMDLKILSYYDQI